MVCPNCRGLRRVSTTASQKPWSRLLKVDQSFIEVPILQSRNLHILPVGIQSSGHYADIGIMTTGRLLHIGVRAVGIGSWIVNTSSTRYASNTMQLTTVGFKAWLTIA